MKHRTAAISVRLQHKRMKRDYDIKVRIRELKLWDLVYQLDTATDKGTTRKLNPSWKGPGVVIEKLTPLSCPLSDLLTQPLGHLGPGTTSTYRGRL
jgi:hypothetical protein